MKIGVLGTGMVGSTIGTKLVQLGHHVKIGSRSSNNPKAVEWAKSNVANASHGTFADAAAFGEILFNCTAGVASIEALEMTGSDNLRGEVLVDVANHRTFAC